MLQSVPHIITDFLVFSLPIPALLKLLVSRRQAVGICIMFALGFMCSLFPLLTMLSYYEVIKTEYMTLFVAFMEPTYAIVVVCSPVFRHLLCSQPRRKESVHELDRVSEASV